MNVEEVLKEFDEWLKENYSPNEHTRRSLVSAVRRILREQKPPDELLLSTKSRGTYRRAWKLFKNFLTYKKINPGSILSQLRRYGAVKQSVLYKRTRNAFKDKDEFNMAVLKGINAGKIYIDYTEDEPILVYNGR